MRKVWYVLSNLNSKLFRSHCVRPNVGDLENEIICLLHALKMPLWGGSKKPQNITYIIFKCSIKYRCEIEAFGEWCYQVKREFGCKATLTNWIVWIIYHLLPLKTNARKEKTNQFFWIYLRNKAWTACLYTSEVIDKGNWQIENGQTKRRDKKFGYKIPFLYNEQK